MDERPADARYGVGHGGKNLNAKDVAWLRDHQGVTVQADGSISPEDFQEWSSTKGKGAQSSGYQAPYSHSTGYFKPRQGYSNQGYGQLRPSYTGGGYAPLPGNDTAFYGEGETQGANPFLNNRNFEQNSYAYSNYGQTGYNPNNPGQYGPVAFNY
jgi:hypothetical protein